MSSGLRLVTTPWSVTTSSSDHVPPALRMSVLQAGPRGQRAAADDVRLDQHPRRVADRRDRPAGLEEAAHERDRLLALAQVVGIDSAAGQRAARRSRRRSPRRPSGRPGRCPPCRCGSSPARCRARARSARSRRPRRAVPSPASPARPARRPRRPAPRSSCHPACPCVLLRRSLRVDRVPPARLGQTPRMKIAERRAHELRLAPERALADLDEAAAWVAERGMVTITPDCALPSLFAACHEQPFAEGSRGFGSWPATKYTWPFELSRHPGIHALRIHRGKRLLVSGSVARRRRPARPGGAGRGRGDAAGRAPGVRRARRWWRSCATSWGWTRVSCGGCGGRSSAAARCSAPA